MIDPVIAQLGIVTFGASAIFLISFKDTRLRRWGYISGLLSQPFWLWATWDAGQWGIFALTVFYTYSWAQGIWNHWVRPE